MVAYKAPVEDTKFILNEIVNIQKLTEFENFQEVTPDLVEAIVEEAAKFCENEMLPLNLSGDHEGCTWKDGVVTTPKGFKEAHKLLGENGWVSVAGDPNYSGQGLPKTLSIAFTEFGSSSNISLGIYEALTQGAALLLEKFASDEIKELYLNKLNTGEWTGTMCLTEPQCGTDLGLIKTKAEPQKDGSYKVTGTKIFITGGEHDLADNIIHLVLAKLPDAPPGVKGISLFLIPKFMPKEDGSSGERNGVKCGSIEEKMGIHASPTCVMNFDEATGYLIGEKHSGMSSMFVMMNSERVAAGLQGLALSEISYQVAREYAKERLQGRSISGVKCPDKPADPIIYHPDVRKMLLTMKAFNEGGRALAYFAAQKLDYLDHHKDPSVRQEADDFAALMTPIIKAFFTDLGFECTNLGMQVLGGYGYIKEYGVEQFTRDARIAQIYEGANGIQALDLVGRKLPTGMGRLLRQFFHPVAKFIEENIEHEGIKHLVAPYAKAFTKLQQATTVIAQRGLKNPDEAGAASTDYLRMFGFVALGYMWLLMAKTSYEALKSGNLKSSKTLYTSKLKTARFFIYKMLPQAGSLFISIMAGAEPLMDFELDEF